MMLQTSTNKRYNTLFSSSRLSVVTFFFLFLLLFNHELGDVGLDAGGVIAKLQQRC